MNNTEPIAARDQASCPLCLATKYVATIDNGNNKINEAIEANTNNDRYSGNIKPKVSVQPIPDIYGTRMSKLAWQPSTHSVASSVAVTV